MAHELNLKSIKMDDKELVAKVPGEPDSDNERFQKRLFDYQKILKERKLNGVDVNSY